MQDKGILRYAQNDKYSAIEFRNSQIMSNMKNIIKEYIKYLKDNPRGYWFKRKLYGWGWTPATWQGWLTLLIFLALIFFNFNRIDSSSHSASDTLINFVPETFALIIILIAICYWKGEKPRWQWGFPKYKIIPYDPKWDTLFKIEKEKIKSVFGNDALAIEHIGSTAVPGLASKPIIDIAVLIASHESGDKYIKPLAELGYVYDKPASSPERHFFRKYDSVSYHLSIAYQYRGSFWKRQILFRDYLRAHEEARKEYQGLKLKLIKEDATGRHLYIHGKDEFIQKILKLAEIQK